MRLGLKGEFSTHQKVIAVHDLDLIRAAAADVDSARLLLQERIDALEAIAQVPLGHGVPAAQVTQAREPRLQYPATSVAGKNPVLAA